jgi:hypothetical protein
MNIAETSMVLAKIQAFDNRTVDDATTIAWHEVLEPHTVQDALQAVTEYFRSNSTWIMPSHIVERIRMIEDSRMHDFKNGYHLNPADDDAMLTSGEWSAGMRRLGRAVRTGALTPEAYEAYQAGSQPLEAFLGCKAIAQ